MKRNEGQAPEKQGLLFSTRKRSATQRSDSVSRSAVKRNEGQAPEKQGLLFFTRKRSAT
ncbi:hypothetical protein AB1J28_19325 [Lysinibacillus irui]|uniref:hypothetical protein n=1 Tax=Lysinibacillus irui TaxID=2998077 RepID=UPI003D272A30